MATARPQTVAFAIRGPITRADLPGLCDRVGALLSEADVQLVLCDVFDVQADAVTVDALARLQLAAMRRGCRVCLCNCSRELQELVSFMGLENVFAEPRDERRPMATTEARMLFPNLAVEDLDRAVRFFGELGFTFDPRFTDESATAMVVNEHAVVMLLVRDRFKDFTKKQLSDPRTQVQALMAFSASSREEVDDLADRALAAGGSPANDPQDMGFMYSRSFDDPDGHTWEIVWMDPKALEEAPAALESRASG